MPFAVFRRHQRKLLAIFAILAMGGFVLSDSLPSLLGVRGGGINGGGDEVVVRLYGKPVYRSNLNAMALEVSNANRFLAALSPQFGSLFGGTSTRDLVDDFILQHEADRLGLPAGQEFGQEWLKQFFNNQLTSATFDLVVREVFKGQVTDAGLLEQIGNQARLWSLRTLPGTPAVTPLDLWRAFRDREERVSVRAVAFPVEDFLGKVGEPSEQDLARFFDRFKDVLPDPARETPGFKIPRQVKVEYLSIDGAALVQQFRAKLTEPEIRTYFEENREKYSTSDPGDLPVDLFQGDPEAKETPRLLSEVHERVADDLAEEKARLEIENRFDAVKRDAIEPFLNKYNAVLDEVEEAKSRGETLTPTFPPFPDIKPIADREHLTLVTSPFLTRPEAEDYGALGSSRAGLGEATESAEGRTFAEELFDSSIGLFDPFERTDGQGRRYLVWKLEDQEPRVPKLEDVRAQVVRAWKLEQARPLAEKAADEFARTVRAKGGKIEEAAGKRPVITTRPWAKMRPGLPIPGQMLAIGPPTPNDIPELPQAGDTLREAIFDLQPGKVAVAPNQPRTVYYVLALDHRDPAEFDKLYGAQLGQSFMIGMEVRGQAQRQLEEDWMASLRRQAGLPDDWVPEDEAKSRRTGARGRL